MSKVISFSISDRYLDKIRSLYPPLTDNLAAKQFLIDQLDEGLDTSLDNNLYDKLRTIEKSLEDRLDATEKSISKLILGFDSQIKNIDQSMKDKSIAIDHQIKAIEARLDERLDDSLDDSLDNILYENYSEIFVDRLDESLDTNLDESLDESLDTNLDEGLDESLDNTTINGKNSAATRSLREIEPAKQWLTLKEILSQRRKNWPKSIEGLRKKAIREGWPSREIENRKEYQIP
jgi:DNA anti-recombination protein RmuC